MPWCSTWGAVLAWVQDRRERIICCASHALSQTEKNYPPIKLECLAIVWVTAKLLHHWSAALEEFDFTIHCLPGKDQGHVDGLICLPIEGAPPDGEDAAFLVQTLTTEEAARQAALELHRATHGGGDALWKLGQANLPRGSSAMHSVPGWHRLQCHTENRWRYHVDRTLGHSVDWHCGPSSSWLEVGVSHHFCRLLFQVYHILIPSKDHTAQMVSNALLGRVITYFGVPQQLLSDRGRKFTGRVWE